MQRKLAERSGFRVRPPAQFVFGDALEHSARCLGFLFEFLQQTID